MDHKYRTWIEIDRSAAKHNYQTFRKLIAPGTKMLGVVKSNAYGHELMGYAKMLEEFGADYLGVDSIAEARTLRRHGVKIPILVLGYTLPGNFGLAKKIRCDITISSFDTLKRLPKNAKGLRVHIKVDTGMHRQGFFIKDLPKAIRELQKHPGLAVCGCYTHFAAAKRPDSGHETEKQIEIFREAMAILRPHYPNAIFHASATAGTLNYPEAHFNMVRVGIGLYGLWPSKQTEAAFKNNMVKLKPVLSWKSIISEIKTVEKNEKIGYDYTETLARRSKIAIIPIGYWHGYFRAFSGKSHVIVNGKRCKVLGRIAMDMTVIDVTDVKNARVGDEVVLIGRSGKIEIPANDLAAIANTTHYELVTRLNPLIKKFFK